MAETNYFEATKGRDNVGEHMVGGAVGSNATAASEGVAREKSEDLLLAKYDRKIVQMGFGGTPLNAITRSVAAKTTKSMRYGYFSIDLRQNKGKLNMSGGYTIPSIDVARGVGGTTVEIVVANAKIFDETDVIQFKGVTGWAEKKGGNYVELEGMCVNALVRGVDTTTNKLKVQFINGYYDADGTKTTTLADGCEIYILGHAAAELDAATVPYTAMPTSNEQFMQKFMVQTVVGNVYSESEKNADWDKEDIDEMALQQFLMDVEKAYIFGAKGYMWDATTRQYTYTTSGIIEQMIENGSPVLHVYREDFDDKKLIETVGDIFVGNSGSNTRYIFTGNPFATALFTLDDVIKYQNVNDTERKFEYDWRKIRVMSYNLLNMAHPMLDYMDRGNVALVLDKQYIERHVFRSLEETEVELKKAGILDAKSTVLCEISSIVLKYAKCHAMIVLEEGSDPNKA